MNTLYDMREEFIKMHDNLTVDFKNATGDEKTIEVIKNSICSTLERIAHNPQEVIEIDVFMDGQVCHVNFIDKETDELLDIDGVCEVLKYRAI